MIKNEDKENNESINSTGTSSDKQANNENINYNDMFKVMFTSMTQMMNMMNTKNEQMMNIMNSLMETINNNNIKKENNELKNIINDLKNTFKLKNNLENLDYWLTSTKLNLRDYSKYKTDTSYEYNLDEEYKLIREGVLMTLEEEIYNKVKNKTLIYDINSLKEEKENNIKFRIKNIENSIKEIKYDYKSWIEDIIISIIEKYEKLEDLRIKKSEEEILESIYHSLPSDLSQEFHGNISSSDKPIKNITLLIKFVRQKKQEEYNKKYNQKNITTLQKYRDHANNINGEDLKKN